MILCFLCVPRMPIYVPCTLLCMPIKMFHTCVLYSPLCARESMHLSCVSTYVTCAHTPTHSHMHPTVSCVSTQVSCLLHVSCVPMYASGVPMYMPIVLLCTQYDHICAHILPRVSMYMSNCPCMCPCAHPNVCVMYIHVCAQCSFICPYMCPMLSMCPLGESMRANPLLLAESILKGRCVLVPVDEQKGEVGATCHS